MPSLLFRDASVLTMDPRRPRAQAALVRGARIAWVGQDADVPAGPVDRVIHCGGATLLPGFNDAHIHLLAYAASLRHLDLRPDLAGSIREVQRLIRARSRTTPPGQWIRGRGYDEYYLEGERHPTSSDLDVAAPRHPVRLDHRSGHAYVLNSLGLERVGIGVDTPDPPEGVIDRDQAGRPTGLLFEMGGYLSRRMRESQGQELVRDSLVEASQTLLKWGVTSLQDASPENDLERWDTFARLQEERAVRQRLTMMPGFHHLQEFINRGLRAGLGDSWHRLGPAKLVVTLSTGALHPSEEELRDLAASAHRRSFPLAIHAVEEEAIMAVLRVLRHRDGRSNGHPFRDRIEHCSEATPRVQALLKGSKVAVVTQPGFLYDSGERYAAQVPQEIQTWLYPLRTMWDMALPMAAGSDAPVASPNPWLGVYGAVTRRNASGTTLHREQGLSLDQALRLYTSGAAAASRESSIKGKIQLGKLADLVLVDRDLTRVEPEELLKAQTVLTMVGGQVVWEG